MIQVTCESCGGTDTYAAARDGKCGGCGMTLCQSCVDVFGHWRGDGRHGKGDPQEEIRSLRAQLQAAERERDEAIVGKRRADAAAAVLGVPVDGLVITCGMAVKDRAVAGSRIAELEALLAEAERERDKALGWYKKQKKAAEDFEWECHRIRLEERDPARHRALDLEAQLRKYGDHTVDHLEGGTYMPCPMLRDKEPCTCGWAEVEASLEEKE